jgi:hypothetical protein
MLHGNMLELLAPPTHAPLRCGTHIAKNQPDVEICALSLSKLPGSRAEFESARGTREFIIAKFLVLALGPPGFGKVPYNSKRSVGQKEEAGKPLYEGAEEGRVRFFSYEKGKTNKDKGERVDSTETAGVLEPGLVLSFFLREDFWDPPKMAPSPDGETAVGVGALVALQLASGNVEGAAKGYLLKLRKGKVLSADADLFATLPRLPQSEVEFDGRAAQYRDEHPALKGSLDSSSDLRCFAMRGMGPDACAFAHEGGLLISNARTLNSEGFRDDIFVPANVARQCLQVDDEDLALRFLNVALALEAVGAIVKTCASNVLLSAEDVHPLVALALVLDVGKLLSLDTLAAPEVGFFLRSDNDGPFEARDLVVSKSAAHVHWHNVRQKYQTDSDAAQVSFTLHAADHIGPDGAPSASNQLSRGRSGAYKTLSVLLTRGGGTKKIVDLELRAGSAGGARLKRKRPELAWEDA